jgi:hypothetical protein
LFDVVFVLFTGAIIFDRISLDILILFVVVVVVVVYKWLKEFKTFQFYFFASKFLYYFLEILL